MRRENESLDKKFYIFDVDKKCDVCYQNIFSDVFYYFNCTHVFHKRCLKRKFIEFNLNDKLKDISAEEKIVEGLVQKAKVRLNYDPVDFAKDYSKLMQSLSKEDLQLYNMHNVR